MQKLGLIRNAYNYNMALDKYLFKSKHTRLSTGGGGFLS
jgi:hypothetical protein